MTDFTKYRNISVSHKVYADLEDISSKRIPGVKLSISKTVETLAAKEKLVLNKKEDDKRAQD
tara:strand:- start:7 stop:192 length:186 start_codon:yes stop_codon:yes gene_type:complete